MATDYIFKFTDPAKTNFVVKPYTFNGHISPSDPGFYSNSSVVAVSANTSVVLLGKGLPDYGNAVQNNFIYLMEHFANSVPPLEPVEGQIWYKNATLPGPLAKGLYVYNGATSSWDKLLTDSTTGANGDFNMGGFNITNLGGTGAQFTAASRNYADNAVTTHAADTALHLTSSQNALLDGLASTLTATELNYMDGVTSSVQTQLDGKLSRNGSSAMTGNLSMGSFKITSLAAPTLNDDAATKLYVDSAVTASGADGTVTGGSFDPVTGVLTLTRSIGAPVTVTGTMAPTMHTHSDANVTHNVAAPVNQSFLVGQALGAGTYPTPPVYSTTLYMDQAIYELQRRIRRQLIVSDGTTTLLSLNPSMSYIVGENKMQVYMNGVKQYMSERGSSTLAFYDSIIGLTSPTGLSPSTTYTFNITVNGGTTTTVSITTPATTPYQYVQLLLDVEAAMTTLAVPATVTIEQFSDRLEFVFVSNTSGVGSSVVVSFAVGSLFEAIVCTFSPPPVNTSITADYAYSEVGNYGAISTQIQLASAAPVGSVLEVLVSS